MLPRQHYQNRPETPKEHHQQHFLPWNFVGDRAKLIDVAMKGFNQFKRDFRGNDGDIEVFRDGVQKGKDVNGNEAVKTKFGVDDEVFEDRRPVVDFVKKLGGDVHQKEFQLFEADDRLTAIMKSVYNVNYMEIMEPLEISSRRMYPRSVERWPIEVVGLEDFEELRKSLLLPPGNGVKNGTGSGGETSSPSSSESSEEGRERDCCVDGGYGLKSLARLLGGEGVQENPMGYLNVAGVNLDKLMNDLDGKEPITPTFAGPFVEHNFCLDYGGVGVTGGYAEYDLVKVGAEGSKDGTDRFFKWRNMLRFKRKMFSVFSFEILAFIFYTFYGDALQLLAARELYRRGWRYHKLFQIWISPWTGQPDHQLLGYVPPRETVVDESVMVGWPSGVYVYFHYGRWAFCTKHFKINDAVVEGRPMGFEDGLWE